MVRQSKINKRAKASRKLPEVRRRNKFNKGFRKREERRKEEEKKKK